MVGFTYQEMDMLGHDYVSVNTYGKAGAHCFKALEEQVTGLRRVEFRLAVITAKRQKMGLSGFVEATESARHAGSVKR